ncbi:cell division control protein [Saitoella coloradoensis]
MASVAPLSPRPAGSFSMENEQAPSVPLAGYVGFQTITDQIQKRMLQRGFEFNIMVVGQSGLGKSTFINTLFNASLLSSTGRTLPTTPIPQTTSVSTTTHTLTEGPVRLHLSITDTPGFADTINNDRCWDPIVKYIKDQHSAFLRKELTAQRESRIRDTRIHCCLYFVKPRGGRGLSELDVMVLKKLADVVNVVPVIAKSDSLTLEERAEVKELIRSDFQKYSINLYPYSVPYMTDDDSAINHQIHSLIPFCVIGASSSFPHPSHPQKLIRGRRTRWGVIDVEDERHCEFVYLRNFLMVTHLYDLIDTTREVHYEGFRAKQLLALKESSAGGGAGQGQQQPGRPSSRQALGGY